MNDMQNIPEDSGRSASSAGSDNSGRDFIISVTINSGGKIGDYYWNNNDLKVGDLCVVGDDNQPEFGAVSLARRPYRLVCEKKKPLGKIIRAATQNDISKTKANAKKEKAALTFCRERIYELDLKMSLSRVSYTFSGRKALFYFTAESRVDFRELVKDLSNFTRVKVEMRQIGVRDEARMLGGCGPCGEELCCSKFLSDFTPVSIRMAKDQMLSLSPEKISGVCGRLMCCLAYEHATYKKLKKHFPKMGKMVETPDGKCGKVCQMSILDEKVGIVFDDGVKKEYNVLELNQMKTPGPRKIADKPAHPSQTREQKEPKSGPKDTTAISRKVETPGRSRGRLVRTGSRISGAESSSPQNRNNKPRSVGEQKPEGKRPRRVRKGRRRNPPRGN